MTAKTTPKKDQKSRCRRTASQKALYRKKRFLQALENGLSVTAAAKFAGVDRSTPYQWVRKDPEFEALWAYAEEAGTDLLEDEATRRAMGYDRAIVYGGEVTGFATAYSDTLLMFMLKARRPEKFGDRNQQADFGTGRVTFNVISAIPGPPNSAKD